MKSAWGWCRIALCAVLVVSFANAAWAAGARVIVVAEMEKAPQSETVAALNTELQRDGVGVEVLAPASANHAALAGASLIVTIGGQAAHTTVALETETPVLHVLLSRITLDALGHRPGGAPWSAIVLDQPAERQIALVRLALPKHERIPPSPAPKHAPWRARWPPPPRAAASTPAAPRRPTSLRCIRRCAPCWSSPRCW